MPWKLENNNRNIITYFLPNHLYTIGRAHVDFIVNDKSISRKHAGILWENNLDYLKVDDFSKFGTFINKAVINDKNSLLKNGDTITFGAQPGVDFKCSFVSFNIVSSNLYHDDKVYLKQLLTISGGKILDNWNESVDYLVMSNLKVTFKVVCALIKQVNIVKIDFIKEMVDYFKGEISSLPNPKKYLPEIGSSDETFPNTMFESNLQRQTLFKNKTFYFMSEEKFTRLSEAITCGGGQVFLLTEEHCNSDMKIKLIQSDSIVMHETIITNLVKMVSFILKSAGKRTIIDSEIGFAVLHVSIDDYCNPSKPYNRLENVEDDVSRKSSPNSSVKIIKQSNLGNPFIPIKRKILNISPEKSPKKIKRMKTKILQTNEENENLVDLDRTPDAKIHINFSEDFKSNSLKLKVKDCYEKGNKDISKILFQPKKDSTEKNNRLFSEIKNNQEDSNDEFDKISVPGFVEHLSSSNNEIFSGKTKLISASSLEKSENVSKILQQSKNSNYLDKENSNNETKISKSNERMTMELFDNQTVVSIPTELRKIQSEVSENVVRVDSIVKFIKLVKEKYVKHENFKTFQKKSRIYIEQNPVNVVIFRK